jgi:hypothetical protein
MSVTSNLKNSQQTSTGASAIIQNWTASAQQQQLHQNSTTTTAATAGRRILPSPVLKQVDF